MSTLDTVAHAAQTPDVEQPWAELGLKSDEYANIREIVGRRPTIAELAMYSVMWSEHCSYKSSKVHLRSGARTPPTRCARSLVGIGENAGVVDIGDGWAVTFKAESHNHPSYVEPYQGAATGVGGIVRDIMSMGARPIAVMDSLRFRQPRPSRHRPGPARVVAGVGGYGNCLGLPNVGGEVVFDDCYQGNPLVNALCVGPCGSRTSIRQGDRRRQPRRALRREDRRRRHRRGLGPRLGDLRRGWPGEAPGRAGRRPVRREGPHRVLPGPVCRPSSPASRTSGRGLSCATSELASNGEGACGSSSTRCRCATSLRPEEILMSESQERMMAIVEPHRLEEFLAITTKWDVEATVLGEVSTPAGSSSPGMGEVIVDVPLARSPTRARPTTARWPGRHTSTFSPPTTPPTWPAG